MVLKRDTSREYSDEGRTQTETEALHYDDRIETLLHERGIPCVKINAAETSDIVDYVLSLIEAD